MQHKIKSMILPDEIVIDNIITTIMHLLLRLECILHNNKWN